MTCQGLDHSCPFPRPSPEWIQWKLSFSPLTSIIIYVYKTTDDAGTCRDVILFPSGRKYPEVMNPIDFYPHVYLGPFVTCALFVNCVSWVVTGFVSTTCNFAYVSVHRGSFRDTFSRYSNPRCWRGEKGKLLAWSNWPASGHSFRVRSILEVQSRLQLLSFDLHCSLTDDIGFG